MKGRDGHQPLYPRALIRDVLEKLLGVAVLAICFGILAAQLIKTGGM